MKLLGVLSIAVAVIACSFQLSSAALDGWQRSTPESQAVDSDHLVTLLKRFDEDNPGIDGIFIVRNGQVVLDVSYYPESTTGIRHNLFSCTKSVMSILVGIALDQGFIASVNQPISDFFSHDTVATWGSLKHEITLEHLLSMTSGLDCRDSFRYQWAGLGEMQNSSDWVQHVLQLPMKEHPGKTFEYCNGNGLLLSAIIRKATGLTVRDFAGKFLFSPLGITDVVWDMSPNGVELGYAGLWLSAGDLAKLGQLYLNEGMWRGRRILSSEWIALSTQGYVETESVPYGYLWWVAKTARRFPWWNNPPVRSYEAVGSNGQRMTVLPDKKTVVVMTGTIKTSGSARLTREVIDKYIIPAIASNDPLPPDPAAWDIIDHHVEKAAQPVTYYWTNKEDGYAEKRVFRRTASPSFEFNIPSTSKKTVRNKKDQVMRMEYDTDSFSASVMDIPQGISEKDFAIDYYLKNLMSADASNVRVMEHDEDKTGDGKSRYCTTITWTWKNSLKITTYLASAYKGEQCVFLEAHVWKHHQLLENVVKSLSL